MGSNAPDKKFNDELEMLLKQDSRFVDKDNNLIRQEVVDKARDADDALIARLLTAERVRQKFFKKIKEYLVFNIALFVDFVKDKNFLGDSYTKFGNKIGLTIGGKYLKQRGDVALFWPFKDCVLEGGMSNEETNRKEIFFNEILAQDEIDRLLHPKVLTEGRRFSSNGNGQSGKTELTRDGNGTGLIRDNLIVKGNNLLALHSLKDQFAGKVKLIYIDPPYNSVGEGNIFMYNNNFNHSTWLTFMKNRLEIAKQFLRKDGFIAIAIDHSELFYLGVLADEIFGRDNRLGIISVKHHPAGRTNDEFFATTNEYSMVYAKNKDFVNMGNFGMTEKIELTFNKEDEISTYKFENLMRKGKTRNARRSDRPKQFYPIYVSPCLSQVRLQKEHGDIEVLPIEDGVEWIWSFSPSYLSENIQGNNIIAKQRGDKVQILYKRRSINYKGKKPTTTWDETKYNATRHGTQVLGSLIGENTFPYPKSVFTVLDTIKILTEKEDIVLDFFAGSGTTGHATMLLNKEDGGNRQFILVEQLDHHIDICIKRNKKVMEQEGINSSFVCFELKKYNQEFINRIQNAKDTAALEKIWEEMKEKSFLNWNVDLKNQNEIFKGWAEMPLEDQRKELISLLDKNQLYVNYSEIESEDSHCTEEEKELSNQFYKRLGK